MKILIIGDVHGNWSALRVAIKLARSKGCDRILQVGDFGFWGESINKLNIDFPVYFIDGNHEQFPLLVKKRNGATGIAEVRRNIYHIPRGFSEKWGKSQFLFIGGAFSIDRSFRTLGRTFFLEEEINDEEIALALSHTETMDVVITHDAPFKFYTVEPFNFINSIQNREKLDKLIEKYWPKNWFFGHYHINLQAEYCNKTMYYCLNCAHWPKSINGAIYDCDTKIVEWRGDIYAPF